MVRIENGAPPAEGRDHRAPLPGRKGPVVTRGRLLERPLEQRREHDLGLGAGDARVVAEALERLLEVRGVAGADVEDRARLPGDRVGGLDLGMALDRLAHLGRGHPPLGVERDQRVRPPAEAAGVDLRGVAADHAVGLEPVDPPLHRGADSETRMPMLWNERRAF